MSFKYHTIEELVDFIGRGKQPKYTDASDFEVFNQACIYWEGLKLNSTKYVTPEFWQTLNEDRKLLYGDLIINSTGTGTLGRVGFFNINNANYTFDSHVTKLRFKNDSHPKFYYYYFSTEQFQKEIYQNCVTGSTNQIELSKEALKRVKVPCLPFDVQKQIAEVLDKADELRQKRKQANAKLDEFLQSVFLDMFGDPVKNSKGWNECDLEKVVTLQRGFDLPIASRQPGVIKVFGSNGILDCHKVPKIKGGGVITGRSGTIGKVFYTYEDYWPLNTSLFSKNLHGNNITYIAYLLMHFKLERFFNGTGVPTLNRNIVHKEQIYQVPLELQNKFAQIVEKVEEQKAKNEASAQKLDDLFNSLLQRAFKGELEFREKVTTCIT